METFDRETVQVFHNFSIVAAGISGARSNGTYRDTRRLAVMLDDVARYHGCNWMFPVERRKITTGMTS